MDGFTNTIFIIACITLICYYNAENISTVIDSLKNKKNNLKIQNLKIKLIILQ